MQVILQQEVDSLGSEGDIVRVARGYANNFLFPKGLAVPATSGNMKQLEAKKSALDKKKSALKVEAEVVAAKLVDQKVTIQAKAGSEGKLYGAITAKDIAAAIHDQLGVEVDRKRVILGETIKEAGDYRVVVRLHPEVSPAIAAEVIASEE